MNLKSRPAKQTNSILEENTYRFAINQDDYSDIPLDYRYALLNLKQPNE